MKIDRYLEKILSAADYLALKLCQHGCDCTWIDVMFWARKKQRGSIGKPLSLLTILEDNTSNEEFKQCLCEMRVLLI